MFYLKFNWENTLEKLNWIQDSPLWWGSCPLNILLPCFIRNRENSIVQITTIFISTWLHQISSLEKRLGALASNRLFEIEPVFELHRRLSTFSEDKHHGPRQFKFFMR
jgi:hypothetical protein